MPILTGFGFSMILLLMALASSVCEALGFDDGAATTDSAAASDAAIEGRVYFGGGEVDLPDGAVVEVRLLDTSRADASAITIGEQVIRDARRLPVAFRIPYDPADIDERLDYTLQARITLGERLLYVNDTVHPVLTSGAPRNSDIEVIRVR